MTLATLVGIAVPYRKLSLPLGDGRFERFLPGAFSNWLVSGREARAHYAHRRTELLGTRTAGTLRLAETAEGLAYECDLPDTSTGRDLLEMVRRLDVRGVSIAFKLPQLDCVERTVAEGNHRVREVRAAMLEEISFTDAPYYTATTVFIRPVEPVGRPGTVLAMHQEQRQREQVADRRRRLRLAKALEDLRAHQLVT